MFFKYSIMWSKLKTTKQKGQLWYLQICIYLHFYWGICNSVRHFLSEANSYLKVNRSLQPDVYDPC